VSMPYADSPGRWKAVRMQDGQAEMSWTPTPDMANPFGTRPTSRTTTQSADSPGHRFAQTISSIFNTVGRATRFLRRTQWPGHIR
jgi:hypothetical protein